MRTLRIYCYANRVASFSRTAESYREVLQSHCELVGNVHDANIVILHVFPYELPAIYFDYPTLKTKYVIGYFVWEADELPDTYKRGLDLIQEVWTASHYCCEVFRKYHSRVIYIPHVIERDITCSDEDRAFIKKVISHEKDCVYFLAVTKVSDPRKNAKLLVDAFLDARGGMKGARIVIKSWWPVDPPNFINDAQVIYLRRDLAPAQLNALYELGDIYVSTHHSEGWGLTLSDAMIFRKPVIATGYSGNLEFMNEANSFLVGFEEDYIRPQDCNGPFKKNMRWAYPDQADLETKMVLLYENLHEGWVAERVARAFMDIKKFDRNGVGILIHNRLNALAEIL